MTERLDPRTLKRLSGLVWQPLRPQFDRLNDALLAVSPTARGVLATDYIKYLDEARAGPQPYAVVWVQKGSEIVVGLALPEPFQATGLEANRAGYHYANLTGYFVVNANRPVPGEVGDWAGLAYEYTRSKAAQRMKPLPEAE